MIKEKTEQNGICLQLLNEIRLCESEADLERVAGLIDEYLLAKGITKAQYKYLEEEQDDRLMDLIEQGKI